MGFLLAKPLPREGNNLAVGDNLDNVSLPNVPGEPDIWRRFQIEQQDTASVVSGLSPFVLSYGASDA